MCGHIWGDYVHMVVRSAIILVFGSFLFHRTCGSQFQDAGQMVDMMSRSIAQLCADTVKCLEFI